MDNTSNSLGCSAEALLSPPRELGTQPSTQEVARCYHLLAALTQQKAMELLLGAPVLIGLREEFQLCRLPVWGLVRSTRNSQRRWQVQEWRSQCWGPGWALQGPRWTQAHWPRWLWSWRELTLSLPRAPLLPPGPPVCAQVLVRLQVPAHPGAVMGESLVPWFPSIARRTSSTHRPPKLPEMPLSFGMTASHSLIGTRSPAIFPLLPFTACFQLCRREKTLRTLLCWERSASV